MTPVGVGNTWRRIPLFFFALVLLFAIAVRAEQEPTLTVSLSQETRLLVVSPHPDDETLGAGGLIQQVLHAGGAVKVILITSGDGYPEGVEMEDHISSPSEQDYRDYGELRQEEAWRVLATLGVKETDRIFLGFPDGGLCYLRWQYRADKEPYYKSPYTHRDRPVPAHVIVPDTEYNGEDLKRVVARVMADFRPTLVATTHPLDQHSDHCSTYFFVYEALREIEALDATLRPQLLTFVIHFKQWPLGEDSGTGARLSPPHGFPEHEWISLPLSPTEKAIKHKALIQYRSQLQIMGRYMSSFVRANELFLPDGAKARAEREKIQCCEQ